MNFKNLKKEGTCREIAVNKRSYTSSTNSQKRFLPPKTGSVFLPEKGSSAGIKTTVGNLESLNRTLVGTSGKKRCRREGIIHMNRTHMNYTCYSNLLCNPKIQRLNHKRNKRNKRESVPRVHLGLHVCKCSTFDYVDHAWPIVPVDRAT